MEKKDLIILLDKIFIPLNFKKRGNNWVHNGPEISKIVNLQKSNYSNAFYINYGYIINNLELTTSTHLENRLASIDKAEQKKITDLLDLETDIPINNRLTELKHLITDKIVVEMEFVNNEKDILNMLNNQQHLNSIPLVVKRHFNLPE